MSRKLRLRQDYGFLITILSISDYTKIINGAMITVLKYTFPNDSFISSNIYVIRSQFTAGISLSLSGLSSASSNLVMSAGANELFVAAAKIYSGLIVLMMSFSNLILLIILYYVIDDDFKQEDRNH